METGTVPIIKIQKVVSMSHVKDNGTIPIITNPSPPQVQAPPSDSPSDTTITLTVTVNAPVTEDTPVTLSTNHSEAIGLPSSVVVTPGNDTVTETLSVTPGTRRHHRDVRIDATCNGVTTSGWVRVDYQGEED